MEKTNEKLIKDKGITLIALVITIIVLLILAGVSISMLTGQNGILTQAQNAKNKTDESEEDELKKLTELEATTNLENTTYKDKNGRIAPIPAGFAVSQVEGENTVEGGLVIMDSVGNEFVWIPVTSEGEYERNKSCVDTNISVNAYTDTGYLPDGIQPTISEGISDEKQIGKINEQAEREVVEKAGGFYISRYEAGKETNGDINTLVSKRGAAVWSNISQENCKTISKTFINNDNIKSALCSGIQWDITMSFVNGKKDGEGNTFNVMEANNDRHINLLEASGQNEKDKVCNIYDLEGNYWEYIAERSSYDISYTYVSRGGAYGDLGMYSASARNDFNGSSYTNNSFRIVLYVIK